MALAPWTTCVFGEAGLGTGLVMKVPGRGGCVPARLLLLLLAMLRGLPAATPTSKPLTSRCTQSA